MAAKINGSIVSGLGEGAFFLSMPHYRTEIESKLNFSPFPGTLNIKPFHFDKDLLKKQQSIRIDGYERDGRKFGGATCYLAAIKKIDGAIIIPDINKHAEIIEFISQKKIREELSLNDGDMVEVELI